MPIAVPATSPFMPLTSFDLTPDLSSDIKVRAELWFYRVGGYLLTNFVDDPAWLALMFC